LGAAAEHPAASPTIGRGEHRRIAPGGEDPSILPRQGNTAEGIEVFLVEIVPNPRRDQTETLEVGFAAPSLAALRLAGDPREAHAGLGANDPIARLPGEADGSAVDEAYGKTTSGKTAGRRRWFGRGDAPACRPEAAAGKDADIQAVPGRRRLGDGAAGE